MKRLIRNGIVIDGTGADAFAGGVLVAGDRIESVFRGDTPSAAECGADETVDAEGALVTPGFVDSHTHSDAYLVIEPDAPSKISQGVTTEINGQCGGSVAPRYGEARLSSDWATLLGERLVWRSLAEYREVLAAAKPAVNTIEFIGHNTLRSSVVGYAPRECTPEELREMRRLLEASLDEGGWGLTTGLVYQPGKYSTPAEVLVLAQTASDRGGYYAMHMRSEGDRLLESIDEVIELAKATGIRAEISHLKTSERANWGKIDAALEKIDAAIDAGFLLGSDRYPYCAAGTDLDIVLPDWAQQGGCPAESARFADASLLRRVIGEIDAVPRDWSTVMIGGTWHPDNRRFSGRRVADILSGETAAAGSPGELVMSILVKDGFKTGGFFFSMCEENLAKILSRPWIVPGSDASLRAPWGPLSADHPHPRAYATMPEFYRRLRALGISREDAVSRMTSVPCDRFGIRGRGRIARGAFADLVVWREDAFRSESTFDEPHRFSSGVALVMVNGTVPYRGGRFTGERGGRFLAPKE